MTVSTPVAKYRDDYLEMFWRNFEMSVLALFESGDSLKKYITVKYITEGKSDVFRVIGKARTQSLERDSEVNTSSISASERELFVEERPTVTSFSVLDIDKWMNGYIDISATVDENGNLPESAISTAKLLEDDFLKACAIALQDCFNYKAMCNLYLAGAIKSPSTYAEFAGGMSEIAYKKLYKAKGFKDQYVADNDVVIANTDTTAAQIIAKFYDLVNKWEGAKRRRGALTPIIVVNPDLYNVFMLNQNNAAITWIDSPTVQSGKIPMFLGYEIVKHQLETGDYTTKLPPFAADSAYDDNSGTFPAHYALNTSDFVGAMFTKDAVGCVMLKDIQINKDYQVGHLRTLVVFSMAYGFGLLNPAAVCRLLKEPEGSGTYTASHFGTEDSSGVVSTFVNSAKA